MYKMEEISSTKSEPGRLETAQAIAGGDIAAAVGVGEVCSH